MGKRIEIDPITRLEGHGKIEIFLDKKGNVEKAYLSIPELRGFEVFCQGKPAEMMPQITARICGVCPTAHHMASAKACDDLYAVEPPVAAKKLREMLYNMFMFEDHLLHFYILGGPDFIVGPRADKGQRNVLGVIQVVGLDTGKRLIAMRRKVRELMTFLAGKVIHPVWALPGGVTKGLDRSSQKQFVAVAREAVDFARFTLQAFREIVLGNDEYMQMITSDAYTHRTYYMGLVDEQNRVNFYDGVIRVVDPNGKEFLRFPAQEYARHLAEHVEPWTYIKFLYLKDVGWKGFVDGEASGVYAVAPLARLNVADGMATPEAQAAYEEMFRTLGGKPVHHTLAMHWARVVEIMYAAERFLELASDESILSDTIRTVPQTVPREGVGVVEAPRGTLFHHYWTDENGLIQKANLLVATQNNAARIAMSVDKAARHWIHDGKVDEGILNMVEMAFRAYDPCHACGTHSLPGHFAFKIRIRDQRGKVIREIENVGLNRS
ncbi:MAG: Ni/Fe hydrogenase subunit alpha [Calditrichaeota bacterium]|nr:Ni/Fe hydrogenase subunit alpha [Calditrichota bacterium]